MGGFPCVWMPGCRIARFVVGLMLALSSAGRLAARTADCGPTPYDCALSHVQRQEFDAAIRALEQILGGSPGDLKALNLLGIALTGAGRAEQANARFGQALKLDPAFHPARKNLAINEYNRGRLAQAQRHLEQVLKQVPGDEVANLYLAEIHYQEKRHGAALKHYEKAGTRFAQDAVWTLHYARCLMDGGATKRAVSILDRLPAGDATSRFEAGVALGQAGAHAEAARFFGSARDRYKDPHAAGYNQTLMLIEAGDHTAAIRAAESLLEDVTTMRPEASAAEDAKTPTKRAELYNLVSRAYLGAGRIQDAYDALRTAARLEPNVQEHYVDLATICLEHENYDLGLEIVDIGLRHRPESWLLYLQKGVLMAMKAQMEQAEKEFETARRLAPDQATPYAALAMAWMQTGQSAKAVEVLRERAGQRSGDHVVPYIFALALLRSGVDPAGPGAGEVMQALRASIHANPDFAPSRTELGRLLLKGDDLDGAVQELEKAVAIEPASTASIYNLAQAYRKKGDRARAAELLSRVSKLNDQERGDDPDAELKRVVVRLVRQGTAAPAAKPPHTP